MAYAFDGIAKTITISAQTVLSVRDVYSRWLDWINTADNSKFLPAFATIGGDDIDATAGTAIPIYAFLLNGWKIKPQESSHTLTVNDGILLVAGGGDPFINTTGNFVVRVNYQQPVQAITVSTGGGSGGASALDIAAAVRAALATELARIDINVSDASLTVDQEADLLLTRDYAAEAARNTQPR